MKHFRISLFLLVASIFARLQRRPRSLRSAWAAARLGQPIFPYSRRRKFQRIFSDLFNNGVSLSFFGSNHFFFLDFAAPNNQTVTVGTYRGATRFPFPAPTEPGLDVSFDGFGCNTLTGSFTVLEAVYAPTAWSPSMPLLNSSATPILRR